MIQFGNDKIGEIYVGSDKIKEVYYGSDLVWRGLKPSYLILTNNTRIDFSLDNTPISNFSSATGSTSSITVNGQSVVKNTIKEIYFEDSYKGVTSIGLAFLYTCSSLTSIDLSGLTNVTSIDGYFLYGCSSLISVDLSPLSNITSISNYFLQDCSSLTSVDLSGLSNITSIGRNFLSNCTGLTSIDLSPLTNLTIIGDDFLRTCTGLTTLIMGAETPPTLGSNAFYLSYNLSLISVPCGSESAYKSATNWINKASKIQEDCSLTPSYVILTDDTRIDFGLYNTPISNLSTSGDSNPSITINGQSVNRNTIKEIYFGDSYNEVNVIGSEFLNDMANLTKIDLSGLKNVTELGNYFISEAYSLQLVDLSDWTKLGYIESLDGFYNPSPTELRLGATIPPLTGQGFLISNVNPIKVPSSSLNAYKNAQGWSSYNFLLSGY